MIACVYPNVNPTLQAAKHVPAELSNLHLFNPQLTWDCPKKHRWMDYDGLWWIYLELWNILNILNGLLVSMMAKPFASLGLFIWSHLIHSHSFWYSNPPIFRLGHGAVNPWMVFVERVSWKPPLHPFAHGWNVADICWPWLVAGFHYPECYIIIFGYVWIIIPSQGRKQRYVTNHQANIMKIYRIYSSSIVRPAASWDSSPHHRPWTPGPGNWIAACLAKRKAGVASYGLIMICDIRWVRYFTSSS